MNDATVVPPTYRVPLAVDLDGTLTRSDTLHESLIGALKATPSSTLSLCAAWGHGKAAFRRKVAVNAPFDAALLPYNTDFLEFLRAEKRAGRIIGLFTAADQSVADAVSQHLGVFDFAHGSDGVVTLSGDAKARAIESACGPDFAFAGHDRIDLPLFARAQRAILVGRVGELQRDLAATTDIEATFAVRPAGPSTWARAFRLHHWAKNALVFVAPALSPPSLAVGLDACLLFVLLGMVASSTYLINDMLDLANDRRHPHKRHRPIASGAIGVREGMRAAGLMFVTAMLLSFLLPGLCTLALAAYTLITLSYSLVFKPIAMVDVTILAGLFTLRVYAGSLLFAAPISPWLLTFSMLFFFGLAVIKRYAELDRLIRAGNGRGGARGYDQEDRPILLTCGVASGFSAIVIFMVYLINDQYPRSVYANPGVLWGIMPVMLIWTLRLWHLAVHGRMSEDPVVFALKDHVSLALGTAAVVILLFARL